MKEDERLVVEAVREIILDEVNVKEIEYVDDDSGIVSKTARPNFPVLGKRLGKRMKPVAAAIRDLSTTDISNLEKDGLIHIDLEDGTSVKITLEEVEIQRTGLERSEERRVGTES